METFIDDYDGETNETVRLQLLTSTVQLFFKTPGEIHKMMSRLLNNAIKNTNQINVKERALFYYKLLKYDINKAKQIVLMDYGASGQITEAINNDKIQTLFNQFNTLSVVYQKPAELFIGLEIYDNDYDDDDDDDDDDDNNDDNKDDSKEIEQPQPPIKQKQEPIPSNNNNGNINSNNNIPNNNNNNNGNDMLNLLDFDGNNDNNNSNNNDVIIDLLDQPQCNSKLFQKLWRQIKDVEKISCQVKSSNDAKQIETIFILSRIKW